MIESIAPMSYKAMLSEKIAGEIEAFLSAGGQVATIPFGAGRDGLESYRDLQSDMAKLNAAEKAAKLAELGRLSRIKYSAGDRYGRLTWLRDDEPEVASSNRRCVFMCDCGTETTAYMANVRQGRTKSCGCRRGRP